ncbi:hypothetical protein WA026_023598 [Henosepilachna vigintioctopunctata]|uniref:Uncharacterized protein n=1 Tax=Henosepilachna vigintioctopunctata TaxID=420089 RepID=A0AAW1UDD2_9CUCU
MSFSRGERFSDSDVSETPSPAHYDVNMDFMRGFKLRHKIPRSPRFPEQGTSGRRSRQSSITSSTSSRYFDRRAPRQVNWSDSDNIERLHQLVDDSGRLSRTSTSNDNEENTDTTHRMGSTSMNDSISIEESDADESVFTDSSASDSSIDIESTTSSTSSDDEESAFTDSSASSDSSIDIDSTTSSISSDDEESVFTDSSALSDSSIDIESTTSSTSSDDEESVITDSCASSDSSIDIESTTSSTSSDDEESVFTDSSASSDSSIDIESTTSSTCSDDEESVFTDSSASDSSIDIESTTSSTSSDDEESVFTDSYASSDSSIDIESTTSSTSSDDEDEFMEGLRSRLMTIRAEQNALSRQPGLINAENFRVYDSGRRTMFDISNSALQRDIFHDSQNENQEETPNRYHNESVNTDSSASDSSIDIESTTSSTSSDDEGEFMEGLRSRLIRMRRELDALSRQPGLINAGNFRVYDSGRRTMFDISNSALQRDIFHDSQNENQEETPNRYHNDSVNTDSSASDSSIDIESTTSSTSSDDEEEFIEGLRSRLMRIRAEQNALSRQPGSINAGNFRVYYSGRRTIVYDSGRRTMFDISNSALQRDIFHDSQNENQEETPNRHHNGSVNTDSSASDSSIDIESTTSSTSSDDGDEFMEGLGSRLMRMRGELDALSRQPGLLNAGNFRVYDSGRRTIVYDSGRRTMFDISNSALQRDIFHDSQNENQEETPNRHHNGSVNTDSSASDSSIDIESTTSSTSSDHEDEFMEGLRSRLIRMRRELDALSRQPGLINAGNFRVYDSGRRTIVYDSGRRTMFDISNSALQRDIFHDSQNENQEETPNRYHNDSVNTDSSASDSSIDIESTTSSTSSDDEEEFIEGLRSRLMRIRAEQNALSRQPGSKNAGNFRVYDSGRRTMFDISNSALQRDIFHDSQNENQEETPNRYHKESVDTDSSASDSSIDIESTTSSTSSDDEDEFMEGLRSRLIRIRGELDALSRQPGLINAGNFRVYDSGRRTMFDISNSALQRDIFHDSQNENQEETPNRFLNRYRESTTSSTSSDDEESVFTDSSASSDSSIDIESTTSSTSSDDEESVFTDSSASSDSSIHIESTTSSTSSDDEDEFMEELRSRLMRIRAEQNALARQPGLINAGNFRVYDSGRRTMFDVSNSALQRDMFHDSLNENQEETPNRVYDSGRRTMFDISNSALQRDIFHDSQNENQEETSNRYHNESLNTDSSASDSSIDIESTTSSTSSDNEDEFMKGLRSRLMRIRAEQTHYRDNLA